MRRTSSSASARTRGSAAQSRATRRGSSPRPWSSSTSRVRIASTSPFSARSRASTAVNTPWPDLLPPTSSSQPADLFPAARTSSLPPDRPTPSCPTAAPRPRPAHSAAVPRRPPQAPRLSAARRLSEVDGGRRFLRRRRRRDERGWPARRGGREHAGRRACAASVAGKAGAGVEQPASAIRYGDVFPAVSGGLAKEPVAPQDAATMQSAENLVFGETIKGGPAAAMQSAAMRNERMGVVGHDQATEVTAEQGVSVSETCVPGGRIVTEFIAGQAVGQYLAADDASAAGGGGDETKITIGEALEAAGYAAGTRPVERSDAAAIQAAEVRATGMDGNIPGGLAAQAQSAADANAWAARDEDKATLGDVLSHAPAKLIADKEVETEDAARVAFAEMRNKQDATARPGGVAASMAAAARLNK